MRCMYAVCAVLQLAGLPDESVCMSDFSCNCLLAREQLPLVHQGQSPYCNAVPSRITVRKEHYRDKLALNLERPKRRRS